MKNCFRKWRMPKQKLIMFVVIIYQNTYHKYFSKREMLKRNLITSYNQYVCNFRPIFCDDRSIQTTKARILVMMLEISDKTLKVFVFMCTPDYFLFSCIHIFFTNKADTTKKRPMMLLFYFISKFSYKISITYTWSRLERVRLQRAPGYNELIVLHQNHWQPC